jgi:hypothetical protein
VAPWLRPLLLLIAALVAQQAPTPSPRADGTIAGQVVDAATGKTVGFVIVTLVGPGPPTEKNPPRGILTTNDGRFVFPKLPAGDFGVSAVRPGYLGSVNGQRRPFGPGQQITLRADERHDLVVPLWKHAVISGTVTDEAGEPIVGIQVRAWKTRDSQGRRRLIAQGFDYTDDRGYYRLHNLPPGEYVVGAGERHVAVPHSWSERAFPTVRQPPGRPGTPSALAVGEQVILVGRGGAIPPPPRGQRLFVYPPAFYPAGHTEHAATPVKVEAGEEQPGIDLQLQPVPTFRVAGRLISPEGGGAGISVRLSRASVSSPTIEIGDSITVADQTGNFAFPAVAEGAYMLRATTEARIPANPEEPVERGLWAELPVTVTGDIDDALLTLETGLRITGRLAFDGTRRIPSGDRLRTIRPEIHAAQVDPSMRVPEASIRTDGSGNFTSIGLARGRYYVRLESAPEGWVLQSVTWNGRDIAATPLELSRGDATGVVLQFTDRAAVISGIVRGPETPDSTAAIVVFPSDSSRWQDIAPNAPGFRIVRSSREGEYALNDLSGGTYYIAAIPDELAGSCLDPDFLERLSTSATLISLAEGERRVIDLRTVSFR